MRVGQGSASEVEWEANSFAAELLMPAGIFRRDIKDRDVCFDTVYELAAEDMFGISATAGAIRLVTLSKEPCAVVVTKAGSVQWKLWSDSFRFPLPGKADDIGGGTLALAAASGEEVDGSAQEVDPYAWIDRRVDHPITLCESVHRIPSLEQIVSLLWVPDLD
jgi:hypothetical protein